MAVVFNSLADPKLVQLIKQGVVGVIPTDTLYGLVGIASNASTAEKLMATKGRDKKPGTIIAANIDQLIELGFKARYLKAVEDFWPGPISIVIPSSDQSTNHLRHGQTAVPVRIPEDPKLIKLLNKTGALLTTSANMPDQPPATNIEEAEVIFGDNIGFYVDGGVLKDRQPSTIIRVIDDEVEVLRKGAVKIKDNKIV